jgi:hypothetical protein
LALCRTLLMGFDDVAGHMRAHARRELLGRNLAVADRASNGDFGHRVRKGERARSGYFVKLVLVPIVRQRGHSDIGDVVGIDERHRPGRQRDLAGQNAIQQIALREILIEPASTHDRSRNAGSLQFRLGALCARLPSAGQQDHPLQPGPACNGGKLGYRFGRAFHRQVGLVV